MMKPTNEKGSKMVLLDARDKPKEVNPQEPPVGDPCRLEGDEQGGLKEKEGNQAPVTVTIPDIKPGTTVTVSKAAPTESSGEELRKERREQTITKTQAEFCRLALLHRKLTEELESVRLSVESAFSMLRVTKEWEAADIEAESQPESETEPKPPRYPPMTDEQIAAATAARRIRNKNAADKAAAPPMEDTHQEEIDSYFQPAESPADPTDWRSVTTREAGIPEAICKVLDDQRAPEDCLTTVGELDAFARTVKEGYRQGKDGQTELTNLRLIGQGKSDMIVKCLGLFWAGSPEMAAAYVAEFPPAVEA